MSNALFTAAVGLQISGFEPSLLYFCAFFDLFSVLFFFGGCEGLKSLLLLFFYFSLYTKNIPVFGFRSYDKQRVAHLFFWLLLQARKFPGKN